MQHKIALVLDASVIIAICEEIEYTGLIDKLLELGYRLIIPSLLLENEITHNSTCEQVEKNINEGKFECIDLNTMNEVDKFQQARKSIHLGEKAVILLSKKLIKEGIEVYCCSDVRLARIVAKEQGLKIIGTIGILKLLKIKNRLTLKEIEKIAENLNKNNPNLGSYLTKLLKEGLI